MGYAHKPIMGGLPLHNLILMTDLTSAKIPCNNPRGERTSEQTHTPLYRAVDALNQQKFTFHSDGVYKCPLIEGARLLVERCPTRFTIIGNDLYVKAEPGLSTPVCPEPLCSKRKVPLDFLNYDNTKKELIKNCGFTDAGYHNSRLLDRPIWHNLDVGLCNANPEFIDRLLNVDSSNRVALLDALLSKSHSIVSQRIKRPEYWGKVAAVYESVSAILNTAMHDQEEREFAEGVAVLLTLAGASHCTSLNGRNGEFTGSDDVKGRGARSKKQAPQPRRKKQAPKRAAPKKKQKRSLAMSRSPVPPMNECGKKYAIALRDPFDPRAKGVCVPRFPTRPSFKSSGIVRATVTCGTNNFGFILITPTLANNYNVCWYSNASTFAGTTADFTQSALNTTSTTGVGGEVPIFLPFVGSDLVQQTQYSPPPAAGRIVCVGIRVWNTTAASDIAGTFCAFVDPMHGNLAGENTGSLGSRTDAYYGVCNREKDVPMWTGAIIPVAQEELEYPNTKFADGVYTSVSAQVQQIYPMSSGQCVKSTSYVNGGAPAAVCFSAPEGSTFAVEIVVHAEYIGENAEGQVTSNQSDSVVLEWVLGKTTSVYAAMEDLRIPWTQAVDLIGYGVGAYASYRNMNAFRGNGVGGVALMG